MVSFVVTGTEQMYNKRSATRTCIDLDSTKKEFSLLSHTLVDCWLSSFPFHQVYFPRALALKEMFRPPLFGASVLLLVLLLLLLFPVAFSLRTTNF